MTRDEILKLEAGRELDALIATEIMRYSKMLAPTSFRLNNYLVDAGELVYVAPNGDTFATFDIPHYSEDIAAAWECEEYIFKNWDYRQVELYCDELNQLANTAWRELTRLPQKWQLIHATPLERCKAMLLAMEAE